MLKKQKIQKKYERKNVQGITLIALVITIIVLLILAGVALATITGDDGVLNKAIEAKETNEEAVARERIQIEVAGSFDNDGKYNADLAKENLENNLKATIQKNSDNSLDVMYDGYKFKINSYGKLVEEFEDISKYVKIGNYVDYEPTKLDKNRTIDVDSSKLKYESKVGTAVEHGNGISNQIFRAKTSEELKWKVFNIENNKVQLISENTIKVDSTNENFKLGGAIGYLYAEKELNEICKIYGYGYGADKEQITQYSQGGPLEDSGIFEIRNSGARSITLEDINKKIGVYKDSTDGQMKYKDGTIIDTNYGNTIYPTVDVFFPTMNSSLGDAISGKSFKAGVKNIKNTHYEYDKSKITNEKLTEMLFNETYWLSSRSIYTGENFIYYNVLVINKESINRNAMCNASAYNLYENLNSVNYAVRPIVTLESNIIDLSTDYELTGEWKLK